jgi:hypothetical protein
MVGAGVDVELAQHRPPQCVLREHAADGTPDHFVGRPLEQLGVAGGAQAARVATVAVGHLLGGLARREDHLVGIDHDHVIAGVDMGGEIGAVLSAQDAGHLGSQATQDETIGVDHIPGPLDLVYFG